jgi:hypothetical protein
MFPGMVSKRSLMQKTAAATIGIDADVIILKGTTQVNTITGALAEYATKVTIIPVDGAVIFGTTGNILVGATVAQNRPCDFTWIPSLKKWVIGPIS